MQKSALLPTDKKIIVVGHRGASGYAPENTLISFVKAIDMGVDMVELDVHLSKDDSMIVMHDHKVNRTTNGNGEINTLTFAEIKALDAGAWFGQEFKGEKVPTLSEVLELVKGRAKILIEVKWPSNGLYKDIIPKVVAIIRAHHAESWTIIQSFERSYLDEAKKIAPDLITHQLVFGKSGFMPIYFERTMHFGWFQPVKQVSSVNIFYIYLNKGIIKQWHNENLTVYGFTPNGQEDMIRIINMGADGLITNFPDVALNLLHRTKTK